MPPQMLHPPPPQPPKPPPVPLTHGTIRPIRRHVRLGHPARKILEIAHLRVWQEGDAIAALVCAVGVVGVGDAAVETGGEVGGGEVRDVAAGEVDVAEEGETGGGSRRVVGGG